MNYFRCLEVLERLKETAERGVLGSLKGDAGKWEKLVKAYESSMLHAAEGGLILSRNVDYEIPYLQKQSAKNRQLIEDLEKKAAELLKNADASHGQFVAECRLVGVPEEVVQHAEALDAALLLSAESLPGDLAAIVTYIKSHQVENIVTYYTTFIKDHFRSTVEEPILPVLEEVLHDGPTHYAVGEKERSSWIDLSHDKDGITEKIIASSALESAGEGQAIEILWDGLELDAGEDDTDGPPGMEEQPIDISWDIDVSGVGESDIILDSKSQCNESDPEMRRMSTDEAVSRLVSSLEAQDAVTQRMSLDASYRGKVFDDILELKAFIYQRVKELKSSTLVFSDTKEDLMDIKTVQAMLDTLSQTADMLTSDDIMNKIAIITSKSHRDRIARKLLTMSGKEKKQVAESQDANRRKDDVQKVLISDSAKLSALVRETSQIKKAVEVSLGDKIRRKVNIQGSIHNILKSSGV